MSDTRGIHAKYRVQRTDMRDQHPDNRHYRCEYFVLDLTHDPHARFAALRYADACQDDRPVLAADLRAQVLSAAAWHPEDGAR
jgi:hypothetical protein